MYLFLLWRLGGNFVFVSFMASRWLPCICFFYGVSVVILHFFLLWRLGGYFALVSFMASRWLFCICFFYGVSVAILYLFLLWRLSVKNELEVDVELDDRLAVGCWCSIYT